MNENEDLRKMNFVGFAHVYLQECHQKSKSDDKIDNETHRTPHDLVNDFMLGLVLSGLSNPNFRDHIFRDQNSRDKIFGTVNNRVSKHDKTDTQLLRECLQLLNLSDEYIKVKISTLNKRF